MAAGFGLLRLSPGDFWAMTLIELYAALDGLTGRSQARRPLTRRDFGALMRRYPDAHDKQDN